MKHLLSDLWFILRNRRFFLDHGCFGAELRDWWADYRRFDQAKPYSTVRPIL